MNQLAFDLVERKAAEAAAHADKVHDAWTEKALAAFRAHASVHAKFTTEDVITASPDVPVAPEKRAWGHIALLAKRQGLILKAGFATAKAAHAHARPVSLWCSLVCAQEEVAA